MKSCVICNEQTAPRSATRRTTVTPVPSYEVFLRAFALCTPCYREAMEFDVTGSSSQARVDAWVEASRAFRAGTRQAVLLPKVEEKFRMALDLAAHAGSLGEHAAAVLLAERLLERIPADAREAQVARFMKERDRGRVLSLPYDPEEE